MSQPVSEAERLRLSYLYAGLNIITPENLAWAASVLEEKKLSPLDKPYGCFNRKPLPPPWTATSDCQYTHTTLGKADPRCVGCKHKKD